MTTDVQQIEPVAAENYPRLRQRLGTDASSELTALGNLDLLALPKTALFCSARCPGNVILRAYDQAAQWRDAGRCVISGFHSPVEKECLQILLRGSQPIIICPARALPQRVPPDWKKPLATGRLLVLSAFAVTANRVTAELAWRRNEFVAALADEVFIAHITPGGQMERRAIVLGHSHQRKLLVVAHTERGDNIRIISARRASRRERKSYEESN